MARLPLVDEDQHPGLSALIQKLRAGRRGRLLNIYRTLLNSPPLAESWFNHSNAVRWKTTLPGRLREIVIIRIGHLTQCAYILRQHIPALASPEGLSDEECAALADWQGSTRFNAVERAALAYADSMTREIAVADALFEELRRYFGDRALLELTVLIASYNMNARVLRALAIDLEP